MTSPTPDLSPAQTAPIRVLLVDDHALFRCGMRGILDLEPTLEVVGEAADAASALALAAELVPDIVLLDVRMPGTGGIEVAAELNRSVPVARVLMLTMSDEEEDLFNALKAGAVGYLLKDMPPEELADTIVQVHAGASIVTPSMAGKLLREFVSLSSRPAVAPSAPVLSPREIEVLTEVARGSSNREVGRALHIAENTVKNHVRNILEKLQLQNRMEAVMQAARDGLITLE